MRRCSLREQHPEHRYSTGERCSGGLPQRPAPLIHHVFPLDGRGRRAYLNLPENLTKLEADRLRTMLQTLPMPECDR